jgi:hypothetical protein
VSKEEALEESGLLWQVGDTGSSDLTLELTTDEYLFLQETDFQCYELASLPLQI